MLQQVAADDFHRPHLRKTSIQRESLMDASCCQRVSTPMTVLLTSKQMVTNVGDGDEEEVEKQSRTISRMASPCVSHMQASCSHHDEIL